jgi:hypothetical protein
MMSRRRNSLGAVGLTEGGLWVVEAYDPLRA